MAVSDTPRAKPSVERICTTSFSGVRCSVELRSMPDGSLSRMIGGYAAVYNTRSQPMQGFREVVQPSFFNKSQSDNWPGVVARFEHNPLMLLGTTAAGTLTLTPDNVGLDYQVMLPESRSDTLESVMRGDITSSSFAFMAYQDDWKPADGGYPIRYLVSGRLIDVAPTAVPAYPDATVALRSLATFVDAPIEDVEDFAQRDELRRFFVRTDNIDMREQMDEETRAVAAPEKSVVTINISSGHAEVVPPTQPTQEPQPEPEPQPEVKTEEPSPAPEPEPIVVPVVAKVTVEEQKPEPPEQTMGWRAARIKMRERENRAES